MTTVLIGIALFGGLAVQDAGEKKASFSAAGFPFEGEVTARSLFVRRTPNLSDSKAIVSIVKQGAKLTVVGEEKDFFRVVSVPGCAGYIFARNLRKEGEKGEVLFDRSPVRVDSRSNADKYCVVKQGAKVKILGQHMGWFKVELPPSVSFYVAKRYVKFLRKTEGPALSTAEKGANAKALAVLEKARALIAVEKAKIEAGELEKVDFAEVLRLYERAGALAKSPEVREEARAGMKNYQNLQMVWEAHKKGKADLQAKLAELRKRIDEKNRPKEAKTFAFTGYLETVGLLINRPGRLRLTMAGKLVCFLREKDEKHFYEMTRYYKKYVGVNGTIVKDPEGWEGTSVVIVDEIVSLIPKK